MIAPPVPEAVEEAFLRYPSPVRARLFDIRVLIFALASAERVGPLTETLKWGEPAYLTAASRSGSTIRLGAPWTAPDHCAVFFNCKTGLVEGFRERFSDVFVFEGNRALVIPPDAVLAEDALAICLRDALTYHRRKAGGA